MRKQQQALGPAHSGSLKQAGRRTPSRPAHSAQATKQAKAHSLRKHPSIFSAAWAKEFAIASPDLLLISFILVYTYFCLISILLLDWLCLVSVCVSCLPQLISSHFSLYLSCCCCFVVADFCCFFHADFCWFLNTPARATLRATGSCLR